MHELINNALMEIDPTKLLSKIKIESLQPSMGH